MGFGLPTRRTGRYLSKVGMGGPRGGGEGGHESKAGRGQKGGRLTCNVWSTFGRLFSSMYILCAVLLIMRYGMNKMVSSIRSI